MTSIFSAEHRQECRQEALQIIVAAYATQPNIRLAVSPDCSAIGSWSQTHGRFVMVAGKSICGSKLWVDMPYEIQINGQPPVSEWEEIAR